MQVDQKKSTLSKFPLRLMPSVRRGAQEFSQKEGVSLNQFINVAVAEKLAHLQHDQWLAHRPKPTASVIARLFAPWTGKQGIPRVLEMNCPRVMCLRVDGGTTVPPGKTNASAPDIRIGTAGGDMAIHQMCLARAVHVPG